MTDWQKFNSLPIRALAVQFYLIFMIIGHDEYSTKIIFKISQHTNTKPGMLVSPSTYSYSSLQDANVSIMLKFLAKILR